MFSRHSNHVSHSMTSVTIFKKSEMRFASRSLFTLLAIKVDPNDPSLIQLANNELKSIGHVFLENSWALHQSHVQRILLKSSQKVSPSTRISSWENAKVEVFNLDYIKDLCSWGSLLKFVKNGRQLLGNIQHLIQTSLKR